MLFGEKHEIGEKISKSFESFGKETLEKFDRLFGG